MFAVKAYHHRHWTRMPARYGLEQNFQYVEPVSTSWNPCPRTIDKPEASMSFRMRFPVRTIGICAGLLVSGVLFQSARGQVDRTAPAGASVVASGEARAKRSQAVLRLNNELLSAHAL